MKIRLLSAALLAGMAVTSVRPVFRMSRTASHV